MIVIGVIFLVDWKVLCFIIEDVKDVIVLFLCDSLVIKVSYFFKCVCVDVGKYYCLYVKII